MNNHNNNQENRGASNDLLSWIVVGICLIAIWPLGLILLIKKLNSGSGRARSEKRRAERENWHQGWNTQQWRSSWDAERDKWRQTWRTERDKWRQNVRPENWGQSVENFISSIFDAVTDSHASTAYKGYYEQPGQSEQTAQPPHPKEGQAPPNAPAWQQAGSTDIALRMGQARRAFESQQNQRDAHKQAQSHTSRETAEEAGKRFQRTGKGLSVALSLLGTLLGLGGVILAALGASQYAVYGLSVSTLLIFILGVFCLLGGISCFITRSVAQSRIRRFNKYAAAIGDGDPVYVSDIAQTVGEPVKKTRRALQMMADAGYFGPEAYIDSSLDALVRSSQAAQRAHAKTAGAAADAEAGESNEYVAIINELHMLSVRTADQAICVKIQRIADLTAKIFRTVEDHPEKKPQVRRFLNIYLPTTIKLLHSYETLEKQGVDGENIQSAKQDIKRILDTLIAGFEQQLDNLFMSDKLDISSDINVLENLMQQDGLTRGDNQAFKTAGGT
jgi:hypothetical protein